MPIRIDRALECIAKKGCVIQMLKKKYLVALCLSIAGACGHFVPEVFSRDFVRHEADHHASLTVVTNAEGIGNFVFVDAPGGRFQVWDESMSGNVAYTGTSGSWPAGRPNILEANAADRSVYVGTYVGNFGSASLRIDRRGFSSLGRPIEEWQNVCLGLPRTSTFEVHGSTLYTLVDNGSHLLLEWRDARNCMLRGSRVVTLPTGRQRSSSTGGTFLAYDSQSAIVAVGVELLGSNGRRDAYVVRCGVDGAGVVTTSDETFANVLPANAGLVDLDVQSGFLMLTSFEPGYDPESTNYELDLYYFGGSRWRLEDSLSTTEVTMFNRQSAVASAARTFTGYPCSANKSGMYVWLARGPYRTGRWKGADHELLERRVVCAD